MQITATQAQKILTGNYTFTMLGFSMIITRLRKTYAKNPSSTELQNCVSELNVFLQKYSTIMAADLAIISKL